MLKASNEPELTRMVRPSRMARILCGNSCHSFHSWLRIHPHEIGHSILPRHLALDRIARHRRTRRSFRIQLVLFDLEHGCVSESTLSDQLRAVRGTSTKAIVRVAAPAPDQIARVLDWGADGIMVPRVECARRRIRSSGLPVMPRWDDVVFPARYERRTTD